MILNNNPIGGIGSEIENLKSLGSQKLLQSQQLDPSLQKAIALQQMTSMGQAGGRQQDMNPQPPIQGGNLIQQMSGKLAQQTLPQPPMDRVAPGVMQQGQRSMQRPQQRSMPRPQMAQGISANPAQNMQAIGRAQGGIIGYAQGGVTPQMSPEDNAKLQEYLAGVKKFKYYDENPETVSPEGRKALELDKRMFEAKFPPSYVRQINEMVYGRRRDNDMAQDGNVKGYATGGQIRAYLASIGRDIADFTQEQITAVSDMLDSQVARGQNDTLRGVARGAMDVLRDRMPSMPENAGATSDAARDFNRRTTQATNERDISPSLTDQLNAAQRSINAENDASMQDVMTSPDSGMGIANIVNAARTAGGDRVSMQDVMTSPDSGMGIANILSGARDSIAEIDPRKSTMGQTIYNQAKKDLSAVPGNIADFVDESGLGDIDYSGMASAILPKATNVAENSDDPSLGRYLGAYANDIVTGPGRLIDGVINSDFISDLQEGYTGTSGGDAETQVEKDVSQVTDVDTDANGMEVATTDTDIVEAATTPTSTPSDRRLNSMAGIDEQALRTALGAAMQTAKEKRDTAPTTAPQEEERGLSALLRDVGGILGRGAGASKGFEFAKIADETRKLDAEERLANRNAGIADKAFERLMERDEGRFEQDKELRKMDITARSEELKQRIEAQGNTANAKLTADVVNDIYTGMAFDALLQAEKDKLRLEATTGSGYFDGKERFDAKMYADAVRRLEDQYIARELTRRMGQSGASTASTPTTPATDRFTVVGS